MQTMTRITLSRNLTSKLISHFVFILTVEEHVIGKPSIKNNYSQKVYQ